MKTKKTYEEFLVVVDELKQKELNLTVRNVKEKLPASNELIMEYLEQYKSDNEVVIDFDLSDSIKRSLTTIFNEYQQKSILEKDNTIEILNKDILDLMTKLDDLTESNELLINELANSKNETKAVNLELTNLKSDVEKQQKLMHDLISKNKEQDECFVDLKNEKLEDEKRYKVNLNQLELKIKDETAKALKLEIEKELTESKYIELNKIHKLDYERFVDLKNEKLEDEKRYKANLNQLELKIKDETAKALKFEIEKSSTESKYLELEKIYNKLFDKIKTN